MTIEAGHRPMLGQLDEVLRRLAGSPRGRGGSAAGEDLLARYDEPRRAYHDRQHLAEVLARIEELSASSSRIDVVRLAAWFHDAVYDPARDDNEQRSAAHAEQVLAEIGLAPADVAEVGRLVLVTRGHDPEPGDADGAVLCDADLGVLGAPPARYAEYAAAVRREYAHVPEVAFRAARAGILRGLLARPVIYRTPLARERWEAAARTNVAAELERLAAAAPPRLIVRDPGLP